MIHYCDVNTCKNGGVCRPLLLGFECLYIGDSYSGRYCEITSRRIVVLKIVSKLFAYIAIIVMRQVQHYLLSLWMF